MTNLVERLRGADISGHGSYSALVREAADEIELLKAARHADSQRMVRMSDEYEAAQDEIERLRAENEQLKIALSDIPRDDGTVVAVGGEPGASAGKSD